MHAILMSVAGLLVSTASAVTSAQTAEMPTSKDFVAGETWEFRRIDAITKLEEARTATTAVKTDTGMAFSTDGKTVPVETRMVNTGYTSAPKPWRVWPLAVGQRWAFEGTWARPDGVTGSSEQKAEVTAFEEVTVPAGKFMAFKIEHRGFFRNSSGNSGRQDDTYWYVPEVKADVKHERKSGRPVWVMELMSYKPAAP
jgi:hypothetical protein